MPILPKSGLQIQYNPYENFSGILHSCRKKNPVNSCETMEDSKKPNICEQKKNQDGDVTLPDFKINYKDVVIKTACN